MNSQKHIDSLIKLSPCKVEYSFCYLGFYDPQEWRKKGVYLNARIVVDPRLDKIERLGVLAHEVGHALCAERNCDCDNYKTLEEKTLSEYHAARFCVSYLLKNRCKDALRFEMNIIENQRSRDDGLEHSNAAIILTKTWLWKVCKLYMFIG